jgi:hypothetical protein
VPCTAGASRFRQLASSTVTFASDGTRYVAWQTVANGAIIVFDSRTGRRRAATPLPGCQLADEEERSSYVRPAAAGRFLLNCPSGATELLLAASGSEMPLPAPGTFDAGWDAVGVRYIEGRAEHDACAQFATEVKRGAYCIALYDPRTNTASYRPQSQMPDIDRQGAPTICARLRDRLIAEERGLPRDYTYGFGLLASTTHGGDVGLERCNGRRTTLHSSGQPQNFDLRSGLLTWDTGLPGEQFQDSEEVRHGTLWSYEPSTGQRRRWTLPRLARERGAGERPVTGTLGYSTHTRNTVFWIATRTVILNKAISVGTSSVYAAPIR